MYVFYYKMASDLPSEFDAVVLGTGMPESIVAAAFSRIGKSVLHLDRNQYYSGDWTSFNFQGIEKWAQQIKGELSDDGQVKRPDVDEVNLLEDGEILVQLPLTSNHFSQAEFEYFVSSGQAMNQDQKIKCSNQSENSKDFSNQSEISKESIGDQTATADFNTENSDTHAMQSDKTVEAVNVEKTEIEEGVSGLVIDTKDSNKDDTCSTEGAEGTLEDDSKVKESDALESSQKENMTNAPEIVVEQDSSGGVTMTENKEEDTLGWTKEKLQSEWRRFNLDLSPKVVYSGGDMVELLISSDIAKYCEFKTVTRLLTLMNGDIEQVPCSRADVFSSKKLSMLEKRMLMKFLQSCMQFDTNPSEFKDYLERPFTELLASWKPKLTPNIQYYIQHSIAMATDSTTTTQALVQMKKFFKSLGRYGNTAFLWSLYGSGELPQSFCRLCAVFGGTYILNMSVSSLIVGQKEKRCTGVITTAGQKIKCKWLFMESSYAPKEYIQSEKHRNMSRAIILADKPLLNSESHELSMMSIPSSEDGERPVQLIELPPSSMASPKGVYVFHLTRLAKDSCSPKEDLSAIVNTLFTTTDSDDRERPCMLWSLYFSQVDTSSPQPTDCTPDNVILLSGPGTDLDLDRPVCEARAIFQKVLPEEEFLPKAPNPEDIIYVDDNQASVSESSEKVEYAENAESGESKGDDSNEPVDAPMGTSIDNQGCNNATNEANDISVDTNEGKAGADQTKEEVDGSHCSPIIEGETSAKTADTNVEKEGVSQ